MSKLQNFLNKNSVHAGAELPLVHTTQAFSLDGIIDSKLLKPTKCPVFVGEELTYLFYGKPSYRARASASKSWLMPVCFLIRMSAVASIKRVFPFDSGAFHAGRHPAYLSVFNMAEFEVSGRDDPSKIVSAFFKTVRDYFKLIPKESSNFESEYSLTVRDSEIRALRDLAGDSSLVGIDDRRFCVEVQTAEDISLTSGNVQAVILPYDYLDDDLVVSFIESELEAVPLPYESFSLSSSEHTAIIYDKVYEFLRQEGGVHGV
ncbi:hypothetical protein [Salipiger mucosus]|uniref:hypothetical protein n=1 Tax=Salipiger mucosus TaxID=263378 RepID=UPI0012EB97F7|nr:hypothetical protein [Salipiger mucosus]